MSAIAPGTLCYLVALREREELSGRVVEVVAEPIHLAEEDRNPWFRVDAPWVRALFDGRDCIVPRSSLRPIVPPVPGEDAEWLKRLVEPAAVH